MLIDRTLTARSFPGVGLRIESDRKVGLACEQAQIKMS